MKFYNRESELAELLRIQNLSFTEHSRLTVITGRRRIGKTSLVMKAVEESTYPTIYLFVGRKDEAALCQEFVQIIATQLDTFVPPEFRSFTTLFRFMMVLAQHQAFNLVIDEFQEFYNINESVYSDMQNVWDRYRKKTKMNLIVSGSIYSLMQKNFQNAKEPLFGRADNIIKLSAFNIRTLKEIMSDYHPSYKNDDLLALYTFTGGVPKYVELLCDGQALTVEKMIEFMARENSSFIDEGKHLLIEEFGKNYGTYFSILGAISGGLTSQQQIASVLDNKSISGQLKRLIEDYDVLVRMRPIMSKENSHDVRFSIKDNFIRFWFNYFERFRSMIEIKNFPGLQRIIKEDYNKFSGVALERYFRQQLAETFEYSDIGSWWEPKGEQYEIDIVALKLEKKQAVAIEVKRNRQKYSPELMALKVAQLKRKILNNYEIEIGCLSLDDM